LPISSNNLLIIGGAVETLILALILAINYSHSRDDLIEAQQFALEQEKQANTAKENLLEVQKRYQDDLEYKVQERTLELEITLRELSEVNQERERTTVDISISVCVLKGDAVDVSKHHYLSSLLTWIILSKLMINTDMMVVTRA
jgi:hypothetical protein